jgi:hypothetical protein
MMKRKRRNPEYLDVRNRELSASGTTYMVLSNGDIIFDSRGAWAVEYRKSGYVSRMPGVKTLAQAIEFYEDRTGNVIVESDKPRRNPRVSKTVKEWTIQGHYGYGWEDLSAYDNLKDANADYRAYQENERGVAHRIIMRRVPK